MQIKSVMSVLFALLASSAAHSTERDLGKNLPLHADQGHSNFSAVYSYGDDPDGTNYLFTYPSQTSPSDPVKSYRWNFYLRSSDSFLFPWEASRTTRTGIIQVKVGDGTEASRKLIDQLLLGQKMIDGKGELYFVLSDEFNVPVSNVSISELCSSHSESFHDITNNRRCDQLFTESQEQLQ